MHGCVTVLHTVTSAAISLTHMMELCHVKLQSLLYAMYSMRRSLIYESHVCQHSLCLIYRTTYPACIMSLCLPTIVPLQGGMAFFSLAFHQFHAILYFLYYYIKYICVSQLFPSRIYHEPSYFTLFHRTSTLLGTRARTTQLDSTGACTTINLRVHNI